MLRAEMSEHSPNPLVTVICATYNSKATLRCTLRSVLHQQFSNFEVLVIGDACTDGTEAVIQELNDPRLFWFNLPQNTGNQSEPNNTGLRQARGKYVAFIGHDDLWLPWHLSRLVEQIEATGADLVHDLVANMAPEGVASVSGPPEPRSGYLELIVPPSAWLHRRELVDEIGYWRKAEELAWPIDYDFTRRAAQSDKKIIFVSSLGVMKFHSVVWKMYALQGVPPQERYLTMLLQNPETLNKHVLLEIATRYALHSQWFNKKPLSLAWDDFTQGAKDVLKACVRALAFGKAGNRWPLGPMLRFRAKRIRARLRAARGLPPR